MTQKASARNGVPPAQVPIPPDTLLVMSTDGGDTFSAATADGCTISRYAWPTILRVVAARLEAGLEK